MKRTLINTVLCTFLAAAIIFPQSSSNERLLEMKNSFALGLNEKGLEIASEILSRNEYADVREEAVFYIAEFHFVLSNAITANADVSGAANIAFTYYLTYKNDYPNSKYSATVDKRISFLESSASNINFLRNYFDYYYTEASIVENSLNFTGVLFTVNPPNPYYFFFLGNEELDAINIVDRYYDEIIVNHPDFEIYAYYWKTIANLSAFSEFNFFTDNILKFNVEKINLTYPGSGTEMWWNSSEEVLQIKNKIDKWMVLIDKKYPHHPITLDLHLIVARAFVFKDGDEFSAETKKHLEFIVQNELNKSHPRYMLAKEFLLNNKFKN